MAVSRFGALLAASAVSVATAGQTALLLVDVQDCFLESGTTTGAAGSLAVPASQIIPVINEIRSERECLFDVVVRTQDFHPANHISFGETHNLPAFSHLEGKGGLPITCLQPSSGSEVDAACCPTQHVNSSAVDCSVQLCPPEGWSWAADNPSFVQGNGACIWCTDHPEACFESEQAMWTSHCRQDGDSTFPPGLVTKPTDVVVHKGTNRYVDAYSGFMDNTQQLKTHLDEELQRLDVDTLYVAGIATDVCVKWTVRDALGPKTGGYRVKVISDASAGLPYGATPTARHEAALAEMERWGAEIVTSGDLLNMTCPASARGSLRGR